MGEIKSKSLVILLCFLVSFLTMPQISAAALSAPTNLSASALGPNEIALTWTAVSGADKYNVYRSTSHSGTYTFTNSVTTNQYTDTGLASNQTYYYKIQTVDNNETSLLSSYAGATTLSSFSSLSAKSSGPGQIYLSWNSISGITSYTVYRSASYSGAYTEIASTFYTNYTDGSLTSGNTYYYKIKAMGNSGTDYFSNIVNAAAGSPGSSFITSNRLSGSDRYETSALISQYGWSSSNYAIIVNGENYPDALCSAPLASKYNAPILLTSSESLSTKTRTELSRLHVSHVFLIGGTSAISTSVEREIYYMGISISRIAGSDRYDTSARIAQTLGSYNQAIIATGENFADALSAAPIAAIKEIPILLTAKNSLPGNIQQALQNVTSTYVVGGTGVISTSVLNLLPAGKRLSGADRYETNLKIIDEFSAQLNLAACCIATGQSFPDALAGSALAAQTNSPVILVNSLTNTSVGNYINQKSNLISKLIVFGGTAVIPQNVVNTLLDDIASVPAAPPNLTAKSQSISQIALSWPTVNGATSYAVYRASSYYGSYYQIAKVSSTSYINSGLSPNTTYYYKIKATNGTGSSAFSPVASTTTALSIPSAPANLTATPKSTSQITLSWSAVSGAASYSIYRSSSASGPYSLLTTITATSYTNSGLTANTTYYYKVLATNSVGSSSYSAIASAKTIAASVPSIPDNLTAVPKSSTQISLSWSSVSEADTYSIYRANSVSGTYTLMATTTTNAYTDSSLTASTAYYYKVLAVNTAGSSAYSAVTSATTLASSVPTAPANLTAAALSSSQISLSWSAVSGDPTYSVYRSHSASGTYTRITTLSSTSYTNTGLDAGTTYYYKVLASNSAGDGPYSLTANTITFPSVPLDLTATADNSSQIVVDWTPVTGASSYIVYRASSSEGTYNPIAENVAAPPYTDTGLDPETTYYYKIVALNSSGQSGLSAKASATTQAASP
ncbi:MAG: cell wall-binding repeat-containing protein [Dehalobacter sp.]|nr:cell wall-binding repeat-containing protein [Dehalobacter sp.]